MSWDVFVLNYGGSPPADPEDDSIESIPLGSAEAVRQSISQYLEIDWSDGTWGIYEGDGFSFEFNLGEEDLIDSMMVHVRGSGDAIPALLAFAKPNLWSLIDCYTFEFLDPEHPSNKGWEDFQRFRDSVITGSIDGSLRKL